MSETALDPTPLSRVLGKVGGRRGLIEGGIPPLVFAATNAIAGMQGHGHQALPLAVAAAAVTAVGILVLSVAQGASLIGAVRGSVLLVVAIGFALWTGSARSFFLPGIYVDALYTVGIMLSIVVGRPVVGFAYALLMGLDDSWRRNRQLRVAFTLASAAWAATYAARTAAQVWLYRADQTELLAVAKLLLGWPLTALAVVATLAAIRHARSEEPTTPRRSAAVWARRRSMASVSRGILRRTGAGRDRVAVRDITGSRTSTGQRQARASPHGGARDKTGPYPNREFTMTQHTTRKWKITTARRPHMALDEQQDHAPYFAQPKDQWRRILFALQQH